MCFSSLTHQHKLICYRSVLQVKQTDFYSADNQKFDSVLVSGENQFYPFKVLRGEVQGEDVWLEQKSYFHGIGHGTVYTLISQKKKEGKNPTFTAKQFRTEKTMSLKKSMGQLPTT